MKITPGSVGAGFLALFLGVNVQAQNVGIGVTNPASKLTVNGNFAVGADFNVAAPVNGAIIEQTLGIGTSTPNTQYELHCYNAGYSSELIESGGISNGDWARLRLQKDSTTNHHNVIEMANATDSTGFQLWSDPNNNNSNDFAIFDLAANAYRVWLNPSGYLGIGTTAPLAPLHVASPASNNIVNTGTQVYFDYNAQAFSGASVTKQTQIAAAIFDSTVWCTTSYVSLNGTITASDARLKNVIGRSDSAIDLKTLEKIQVTDYTMKDVVQYGNEPRKKVIAQQVEQVYPTAVTSNGVKGFTFTPDVYAVSDSIKIEKPGVYVISLAKAHDLKNGDTVRLITSKNPDLTVVAHVVNDKTFTVETKEPLGEKVFVYGKQCLDLKAVDYDAISMLNVSATQELAKKVENLEQENSELRDESKRLSSIEAQQGAEIAAMKSVESENAQLKAEVEALKKAVATMQQKDDGAVRTVALAQ